MAAMPATARYDSASGKKPGVGPTGTNRQPDPLGTFRAVALVSGIIAVDVDSRVYLATREPNADEPAAGRSRFATRLVTFGNVIR
jgi:hypothetical protein